MKSFRFSGSDGIMSGNTSPRCSGDGPLSHGFAVPALPRGEPRGADIVPRSRSAGGFPRRRKKPPPRKTEGAGQRVKKASQSLPPAGGKGILIIFCRGVYLTENTTQAASVRLVRCKRARRARSRLQSFCQKRAKPFFDSLNIPGAIQCAGDNSSCHTDLVHSEISSPGIIQTS